MGSESQKLRADELRLLPLDSMLDGLPPQGPKSLEFGRMVPGMISPLNASNPEPRVPPIRRAVASHPLIELDPAPVDERRSLLQRLLHRALPSWVFSLLLHFLLILVLAAINFETLNSVTTVIDAGNTVLPIDELDEFVLSASVDTPEEILEPTFALSQAQAQQELSAPELDSPLDPTNDSEIAKVELSDLVGQLMPRELLDARTIAPLGTMLGSRSGDAKSKMLAQNGGTAGSEKAVALALKWLARHQWKDGPNAGAWNFHHGLQNRTQSSGYGQFSMAANGATGLALLPFLGAGQTHREGQYQKTVQSGLDFLVKNRKLITPGGRPCGSWHESQGEMYSHAIAAISMCEAYAMTLDPELAQPAQLSLNYLVYAQDPQGGGWRYLPQEPGDTSVVGWCLMALKSGSMGQLKVPTETYYRTTHFLDFVGTDQGAHYGYVGPGLMPRRSTTAVGLLCRMYLGWPKEREGMQKGVQFLSEQGPDLEDLYYSYYATQVMRHFGGSLWHQWNQELREALISSQITEGVDAGSWDPIGNHTREGGRLCQTAMAAMILEVYYRHLPLYQDRSSDSDDFQL